MSSIQRHDDLGRCGGVAAGVLLANWTMSNGIQVENYGDAARDWGVAQRIDSQALASEMPISELRFEKRARRKRHGLSKMGKSLRMSQRASGG